MAALWSKEPVVSLDKHFQMARHNEALTSADYNLSKDRTDELGHIVQLMSSPLDWSHASLHDINPQTLPLSALETL
jgi:hypothetical protein